jgi:hypothetical protein
VAHAAVFNSADVVIDELLNKQMIH